MCAAKLAEARLGNGPVPDYVTDPSFQGSRRLPGLGRLSAGRCLGERFPFARFLLLQSRHLPRSLLR
jgi:hypothetical protein